MAQAADIFRKVYRGLSVTPQQVQCPIRNACRVEMGIDGDRVQFDRLAQFVGLKNYVVGAGSRTNRDYIFTANELNRDKFSHVDLIMTPIVIPLLLQDHEMTAAHLTMKAKAFDMSMRAEYSRKMIDDVLTDVKRAVDADKTNLQITPEGGAAINLNFAKQLREWAGDNYLTGSNGMMGKLHAWLTPEDFQSMAQVGEASGRDFRPDAGGAMYSGADTFYFRGIYWHELVAVGDYKGGTSNSKNPVFLWAEQGVGIGIGYDFKVHGPNKVTLAPGWEVQGEGFSGGKVIYDGTANTKPAVAIAYVT